MRKRSDVHAYAKRGLTIRVAYLLAALVCWIFTGFGRRGYRGTVVLCFHNVRDSQREQFHWQMKHIARQRSVDGEITGRARRMNPFVDVTFDDAFASLEANALPVMKQLGIPATIFAVTEYCGDTPGWSMPEDHPDVNEATMDESTLCAIDREEFVRIESHTDTHRNLTRLSPSEKFEELHRSKMRLESMLERVVTKIAMPYGAHDPETIELALKAGYCQVFTLDHEVNETMDRTHVRRFCVSPDMWRIEFRLTVDGAYGWLASWRRLISRLRVHFLTHTEHTSTA